MAEHQVSVDGSTYPLPDPFLVIATQNPTDLSGTFPLPDSQLDRFTLRIRMGYIPAEQERALLKHGIAGSMRDSIRISRPGVTAAAARGGPGIALLGSAD